MKRIGIVLLGLLGHLPLTPCAAADQPVILSLQPDGQLTWSNNVPGLISVVERSTNLTTGNWLPHYYDWATNGLRTIGSPAVAAGVDSFYRISVITNPPDDSLVMHLSFDNDFPDGAVLDASAHGNHGRRYGRPGTTTNFPSIINNGPDGSQAARFQRYSDGFGLYGKTGDYIGIPITPDLASLPSATIALWAHYFTSPDNNILNDHTSTLMNSGKDFPGTFYFGRNYANYTSFIVDISVGSGQEPIIFPDNSPVGNSGGWHHYVITFDSGTVKGYFDGKLIGTGSVPVSALRAAGHYIGIACWTFNVTPELDLNVDAHPNNAWINGAVDDVRIYRRVLSAADIEALYRSSDRLPPSAPTAFTAEASASSLTTLRWSPSTDLFGVSNYVVFRNGLAVGETTNTVFFDAGLSAGTEYDYAVRAQDLVGLLSAPTPTISITSRPANGGVELKVDDADGDTWTTRTGVWTVGLAAEATGVFRSTFLSDGRVDKGKMVTYTPPLPEVGDYDVYIWHPGVPAAAHLFSDAVPVDIVSAGATNTVFVNQKVGLGQWKLLGRYPLGSGASVRLRTDGTTGYFVFADAVRFVK